MTQEKQTYRKLGGGSMRISKTRRIKSGQIFEAYENEIPKSQMRFVEKVEGLTPTQVETNPPKGKQTIDLKESKDKKTIVPENVSNEQAPQPEIKRRTPTGQWYDVLDGNGVKVNKHAVRLSDAEKLLDELLNV